MYQKLCSGFFCLAVVVGFTACAQTKKATAPKSGEKYAKLISATSQYYSPGAAGSVSRVNYRLIILWKNKTPPTTFFWRGNTGWQPCEITKLKKEQITETNKDFPYMASYILLEKIRRGDTLQIIPTAGAKDVAPTNIPAGITNTIFFKIDDNKWLYLPVKNIKELPEITGQ